MPTTRTPIGRPPAKRITEKAIALFKELMTLEPHTVEWYDLDHKIHTELKLKVYEGCPTITLPGSKLTHPPGTAGHRWDTQDGPALYKALLAAAA